ncbi:hypothetical protein AQUCO_00300462v1 [Aquilegia coerulea]|uniref:WRC domain-containing protein n=1 Tax=Aquilegia coerulea TaxID=218851 RepID=A0A2G5EZ00_AQUCA|nr:hypothetical protein AQUCO_00300462v1 [Aquilegia coerulea]
MEETQFIKGMEVEVCSDDVGLRGAWFTATVIRANQKRKLPARTKKGNQSNEIEREKVYVEYHTLVANEKSSKPLREYVDSIYLRPIPPREVYHSFQSSDEVDAYYHDGWWEGIVIRVVENSRYVVYFRSGKEEIEFGQSDLRIHREWVKGLWKPPMLEEKVEEDADVSLVPDMEDKAEKLQEKQINLEDGSVQAFDVQASAPDKANDKTITSLAYNTSVPKDKDREHNEVDGRRSDQANLSLVYNTADAANESNTRMENIKRPTPESNKISQSCKKLKESEVTEGCSFVNIDINETLPSTSPLEELTDHPARSIDRTSISCVLNFDGYWSHPALSEFSSSALANIGEKECESSKPQVECSQENIADQSTPYSSQCPDLLEQEGCNKKRRRGPRKQSQFLLDPLLPSGDMRCRRTGKGWRCREMALSEKIYCEKHQLEQVLHNKRRRKGPKKESRFAMDPLLPSGHPQCRRSGKGWRCSEMALLQKIYCEKHQLEQDTYNEKRRKRRREQISLVACDSEKSSQFNSDDPLPSDDQQCSGVVRDDTNQRKGEIGGHETANLKTRGHSEEMLPEASAKGEQATANLETRGQSEEMLSEAPAKGEQTTANLETRGQSEEMLSEAPAKGEQATANLETGIQLEEMVSEASAQDPFLGIALEFHRQTPLRYPLWGP